MAALQENVSRLGERTVMAFEYIAVQSAVRHTVAQLDWRVNAPIRRSGSFAHGQADARVCALILSLLVDAMDVRLNSLMNQQAITFDMLDDFHQAVARLQIGENKRPVAAHEPGIAVHHFE